MSLRSSRVFPLRCPQMDCSRPYGRAELNPKLGRIVRKGRYFRAEDSRWISRFHCRHCERSFSSSRFSDCFGQKKRKLNASVRTLLCSGVSQRRIARILRINRKTVVRKFLFLADQARTQREGYLQTLQAQGVQLTLVHMDEMESFERSKCLPLSIPLMVAPGSRKILGFRVAVMPAKGLLAQISRKKYGRREDHRATSAASLFLEMKPLLAPGAVILTDQNPHYPGWLRPHFPNADHKTVKGRRGCVVGQGELKKIGRDPLFDLNHTCAMIRANINRLFRRTWCTTKRPDRLCAHLEIYAQYHNNELTPALKLERVLKPQTGG